MCTKKDVWPGLRIHPKGLVYRLMVNPLTMILNSGLNTNSSTSIQRQQTSYDRINDVEIQNTTAICVVYAVWRL